MMETTFTRPTLTMDGDVVRVNGDLTVDTLTTALKQLSALSVAPTKVAFSSQARLDSAAVVFLIECRKRIDDQPIVLCSVSEHLEHLLDLYALSDFFAR